MREDFPKRNEFVKFTKRSIIRISKKSIAELDAEYEYNKTEKQRKKIFENVCYYCGRLKHHLLLIENPHNWIKICGNKGSCVMSFDISVIKAWIEVKI